MKIPLMEQCKKWDSGRMYRCAIWNILLFLKPKYSLEIGTYIFQTSDIFSKFYQQYMPEGKLITTDVAKWDRREDCPLNVYPLIVWPQVKNIENNHGQIDVVFKDYEKFVNDSLNMNSKIILDEMNKQGIVQFDFVFVDGDHSGMSFVKDLMIAKNLTKDDGYILIDDIYDNFHHEQVAIYNNLKNHGNIFYEFEDWPFVPGVGLIQNKNLIL